LSFSIFCGVFFTEAKDGLFLKQKKEAGQSNEGADRNGSPPASGSKPKDPYEVLQIPKEASQEEIKAAYKHLAGKYHPDKVLHLGEEFQSLAEERFKEIQSAYQKLAVKDRKDRL
jgi:DnaJ like chaperone protein